MLVRLCTAVLFQESDLHTRQELKFNVISFYETDVMRPLKPS